MRKKSSYSHYADKSSLLKSILWLMLKHRRWESIMQYFSCLCCYFYSWTLLCWATLRLNNCWKGSPTLPGETKRVWGLYLCGKKEVEKGKQSESKSVLFIWTAQHELNHTTLQAIPAEIVAKSFKVSWDEVPHSLLQTAPLWWPWSPWWRAGGHSISSPSLVLFFSEFIFHCNKSHVLNFHPLKSKHCKATMTHWQIILKDRIKFI